MSISFVGGAGERDGLLGQYRVENFNRIVGIDAGKLDKSFTALEDAVKEIFK